MSNDMYTDDKLNLFIDEELDFDEMDNIHQAVLKDTELSTRVCQLKAIRELVRYAYESTPVSDANTNVNPSGKSSVFGKSIAAGFLLTVGVVTGWLGNEYSAVNTIVSESDVFDYFKYKGVVDRSERKIVIHVTTGDVAAIESALDEVDQLLASYKKADAPMQLDIVTFKDGINMLKVDSSAYASRVENLIENNDNVAVYACHRSIVKAEKRWGKAIVLIPQAITTKTAKEIISERIKEGWVYIKV